MSAENLEAGAPEMALVLSAGVHGVTRLLLDGALPFGEDQAQKLLDALISGLIGGLTKQPSLLSRAPRATQT